MISNRKISAIASCIFLVAILSGLLAGPALGQQPERVKVLIAFGRQPGPAEEALVRGMGGSVKYTYHLVPAIAATLPEPAISALAANPRVTRIELDAQMRALDTELDNTWGVTHISADTIHDGGNRGAGIKIAIIDSGINYNHPDLNDNYQGGNDFVQGDDDPMDVYGHGTHVAGTACAEDNDNGDPDGPYGVVGVAPACALYALRVLDDNGYGDASDLIAALQWALEHDIQVANLSLGWDLNPGDTVREAFDNADAAGLVIVAAACNNGNRPGRGDNVCYPALYDSVIAVAAIDDENQRASFSSTGEQVELAAPGVSVFSTWNDDTGYYDPQPVCRTIDGVQECYKYGSGTSMASPHVAGTAALILAANLGWTNDQVRAQLRDTANDLGDPGWDPHYGFGLVDAAEAAAAGTANEPPVVSISSPADGASFGSGTMITFEGTALDAEDGDLASGLAWESSIDGELGTGGSISAVLSDGNHIIAASVTDAGGSTAGDSITVIVGGGGRTMYVFEIRMSSKTAGPNRTGIATVTIKDTDGTLVSGATVDGIWSGDYSGTASGVTGTDGAVRFETGKVRHAATFTFTVDNVLKSGYTYDPGLNNQTSATIEVP